jgi:hypothetical protein
VYIAILIFYFVFIYLVFPETKRLSAEDASRAFDYDKNGVFRGARNGDVEHESVADKKDEQMESIAVEEGKR